MFPLWGRCLNVRTFRRYEGVGRIDDIALAAKEQFFPLFERLPGLNSHTVVDTADNTVMSVTIFETRAEGQNHGTDAAAFQPLRFCSVLSSYRCDELSSLSMYRSASAREQGHHRRRRRW
jgi:hypothetical protein